MSTARSGPVDLGGQGCAAKSAPHCCEPRASSSGAATATSSLDENFATPTVTVSSNTASPQISPDVEHPTMTEEGKASNTSAGIERTCSSAPPANTSTSVRGSPGRLPAPDSRRGSRSVGSTRVPCGLHSCSTPLLSLAPPVSQHHASGWPGPTVLGQQLGGSRPGDHGRRTAAGTHASASKGHTATQIPQ